MNLYVVRGVTAALLYRLGRANVFRVLNVTILWAPKGAVARWRSDPLTATLDDLR